MNASLARPWAVALAVVAAGATAVVAQQAQPRRAAETTELKSMHVQGKIHMIVGAGANVLVSVGDDGVLVVDSGTAAMSEKLLAEINKLADGRPIRLVINTHFHPDHTGGNEAISKAGGAIVAGNFAQQINTRTGGGGTAFIFAHENTLRHFELAPAGQTALPVGAWPTDVFFGKKKDFSFNGEAVVLLYEPGAHTDGDILVHFRGSDVVAAGDAYVNTSYPVIDRANGGTVTGYLSALNELLDVTVPLDKQEAGTFVVPGHGRLADEADVVEYRDMLTIIRDRVEALKKAGMTLQQVVAARPSLDYDGRYAADRGPSSAAAFIEAAYAGGASQ
jgi:glyoxylase-like metal-dependent hydrolase (beta-lactamase superfamily II)